MLALLDNEHIIFAMLKSFVTLFKSRDMTKGNLFGKMILFAIPAMLTTMMQLLYVTIDLTTVHYGDSAESMGATASSNIEGYFYAICDAIAVSTMTFIAANVGAKNKDNIKKCILFGLIWGMVFNVLIAVTILLFHNQLLSLFVDNEESIKAGYTRLAIMAYLYFLDFTMIFTAAVLRGLRRSTFPMLTTLLCCTVLRIVLILTLFPLEMFHTVFWLYALFPITWVIATIMNVIALIVVLPKDLKRIELSRGEETPLSENL